jgi:hypothetical protein
MLYGKLVEAVKYQQLFESGERTSNATLFNGVASTSQTGYGIDTRDYDEVNIVINAGLFETSASLASSIYECATDDPSSATAVTSATFTAITTANDEQLHIASIRCMGTKRYLFLRTVQTGSSTSRYGAVSVLGKADAPPASNSPVFDLNGD